MERGSSNYYIDLSNNIDYSKWDENLAKCAEATVFQTSLWAKVYSEYEKDTPIFIYVKDRADTIVAQLLLFVMNKDQYEPGQYSRALRFASSKLGIGTRILWNYGPLIQNKTHIRDILQLILHEVKRIAKDWNATLIAGSSPPLTHLDDAYLRVYADDPYQINKWGTFIVDVVHDEEILWSRLDKKARNDVRRAEKKTVIKEVTDDEHLVEYALLAAKFNKTKRGIISNRENAIRWFRTHWKCMHESNIQGRLILAYQNESPVAGLQLYSFNGNVTQHAVLNDGSIANLGGPLLTWNAIKCAHSIGARTFDFVGVNPSPSDQKEKAIYFYKSKWGGDLRTLYKYTRIVDPLKVKLFSALSYSDKLTKFITKSLPYQ